MTQAALPLEPVPVLPIQEAYQRSHIAERGLTLEQALTIKPLAIALRCYAEAIMKTRGGA